MDLHDLICGFQQDNLKTSRTKWINAVEILAGSYYIGLSILGFRNIYVIFFKQRKVGTVIFPLMYLFAQSVCILQTAQCFLFYSLNR
jgi:hypothetical protein